MSHAEVSDKWKETDHQDPISYLFKFGKTVDGFRLDVQKEINKINGVDNKMTIQEAMTILQKEGVINSPEYWGKALSVTKYLDQLFINFAEFIKEK